MRGLSSLRPLASEQWDNMNMSVPQLTCRRYLAPASAADVQTTERGALLKQLHKAPLTSTPAPG